MIVKVEVDGECARITDEVGTIVLHTMLMPVLIARLNGRRERRFNANIDPRVGTLELGEVVGE